MPNFNETFKNLEIIWYLSKLPNNNMCANAKSHVKRHKGKIIVKFDNQSSISFIRQNVNSYKMNHMIYQNSYPKLLGHSLGNHL